MLVSIKDYLPDQLPLNEVKTTDTFRFEKIELPDGETEYKNRYILEKAPIKYIQSVEATVDRSEKELQQDEDFELVEDGVVVFTGDGELPDLDTNFYVTYVTESILSRYIETVEEETSLISGQIGVNVRDGSVEGVTASKYISTAGGDSLDEIGKLFGDLGVRAGRSDERYREYLKAIARVYTGSGRKEDVAEAAATIVSDKDNTVDIDTIEFEEYFDEYEYSIRFTEFENHRVSLIDDILDLTDPSGVRLRSPIYSIDSDNQTSIEGPKPDPDKYSVDSADEFVDDFINPFNHVSPTLGEYPSNILVDDAQDILDVDIEYDFVKPIKFQWAKKIENSKEYKENGVWSTFQWGEDSWSGLSDSEEFFTGANWEQADWNKFPYGDFGVVGDENVSFGETVEQQLYDITTDDTIISDADTVDYRLYDVKTDDTINGSDTSQANITFYPLDSSTVSDENTLEIEDETQEEPLLLDENTLEIEDETQDSSTVSDEKTLEIEDQTQDSSTVSDEKTLEIEDETQEEPLLLDTNSIGDKTNNSDQLASNDELTRTELGVPKIETTASSESLVVETSKFAWSEDWDTMQWSNV